jgi:hypothetical protein
MSDTIRKKGRDFAKFLASLPEEERAKGNKINSESAAAEYQKFLKHFSAGYCYLCREPLHRFILQKPCPHWLLKPQGFKKQHLLLVADKYGFFQLQSYLRWVANQEEFAQNINDLPEEGTGNKLFETTIKYKNLEWAFSCSESDYQGHQKSSNAKHSHYHLQMRIDGNPYINYGNFHLPFSERDIIEIEAQRVMPDTVRRRYSFGESINDVLISLPAEELLDHLATDDSGDYERAPFAINTFAAADDGTTIDGDELNKIIQEARARGVPIASLMHKLSNVKTTVVISPGPGVVEQAPRSGGRSGSSDDGR